MRFPSLVHRLRLSLEEDGAFRDATSGRLPGFEREPMRGHFIAKARGVFFGAAVLPQLFSLLDRRIRCRLRVRDGALVRKGQTLADIAGPARAVLAGERVALNLICHLSGVATLTRHYVDAVHGTNAAIVDTRKTTPLWRDLEKAAVRAGGGINHRFSLADAVLAKDNHLAFLRRHGLAPSDIFHAKRRVRGESLSFVSMEAATTADVWEAINAKVDIILLDNMPPNRLKEAVLLIRTAGAAMGGRAPAIEVSGGMTPVLARRAARLGVDRISVGALTHSAPVLDVSLEVS